MITVTTVVEKAYAKINLGLNILGDRPDGYHEVAMVMQSVGLCDTITISEGKGIEITTNLPGLSCGADNLAYKAADKLAKKAGIEPNVHIHLEKKIFMAAGLAGGSSDAAAALKAVNEVFGLGHSNEELKALFSYSDAHQYAFNDSSFWISELSTSIVLLNLAIIYSFLPTIGFLNFAILSKVA